MFQKGGRFLPFALPLDRTFKLCYNQKKASDICQKEIPEDEDHA